MNPETISQITRRFYDKNIIPRLEETKSLTRQDIGVILNLFREDWEVNVSEFLKLCNEDAYDPAISSRMDKPQYYRVIDENGPSLENVNPELKDAFNLLVDSHDFRKLFEKKECILLLVEKDVSIYFMTRYFCISASSPIYDVRKFVDFMVNKAVVWRNDYINGMPKPQKEVEIVQLQSELDTLKREHDTLKQERAQLQQEFDVLKRDVPRNDLFSNPHALKVVLTFSADILLFALGKIYSKT